VPENETNHVSRTILRDILVLEAAVKADVQTKITDGGDKGLSVKLALTDAQEHKLFWMTQNGAWTLTLRPPKDASDSPEAAESYFTLLEDGLKPSQIAGLWKLEGDQ
jgi:hypothetical protein